MSSNFRKNINRKRKPNKANLANLYVVGSNIAYDSKNKLKTGVYGVVGKDTPYVYKIVKGKNGVNRREFTNDMTTVPNVCKNRIMAFWDDKNNKTKRNAYLVDKKLYDEYKSK